MELLAAHLSLFFFRRGGHIFFLRGGGGIFNGKPLDMTCWELPRVFSGVAQREAKGKRLMLFVVSFWTMASTGHFSDQPASQTNKTVRKQEGQKERTESNKKAKKRK